MNHFLGALLCTLFFSISALADISIDCAVDRTSTISLSSSAGGFDLLDGCASLVGENRDVRPMTDTANLLEFSLDDGTSVKHVYEFSGLAECIREGSSTKVTLTKFRRLPDGVRFNSKTHSCSCHAD